MAYIGRDTDKISNVEVLDNITFNGSSSYTLQKGGSNFTPSSANTLLLSIDGVVQAGNFTVSGSTIDFGTAVAGTSTCDFILHYGVGLITIPADGSVTAAKLASGVGGVAGITSSADATAITIDSNENVSIGTNVAIATLNVLADSGSQGIDVLGRSSDNRSRIQLSSNNGTTTYSQWDYNGTTVELKAVANVPLVFRTNNTERMRITSAGKFGMNGKTNPQYTMEFGDSGSGNGWSLNAENSVHKIRSRSSASDTQTHVAYENTNGTVGTIKTVGTSTQYNTSSDYRLKENVDYNFDATTRLKQLKPARFNFIADADTTVDGFLAHEVSSIVPEAISGEKDATETKEKVVVNANGNVITENIEQADWETGKIADEDGNTQYPTDSTWQATKVVPDYQGIDQAKLVPLLVKTIQELEARITQLENA